MPVVDKRRTRKRAEVATPAPEAPAAPAPEAEKPETGLADIERAGSDPAARASKGRRRRRRRLRRLLLRTILWGLAALAVLVLVAQLLVDTPWARRTARDLVASQLSRYLQRPVEIADLSVELLPLSIEVQGFEIAGPHEGDPPFLRVPWAAIYADLNALQHRKVHLREVRVERPEVNLQFFFDRTNNIPKVKRGKKRRPRTFEILVDRLEVDRADFSVDQERVRLSVATEGVRARFQGLGDLKVGGQAVAQRVVVRLPNARPITVSVSAEGIVERDHLEVLGSRITGPDLAIRADGTCDWTPGDRLDRKCLLNARGTASGDTLALLGYFEDLEGGFDFDGTFAWRPGTTGWRGRVRAQEVELWGRQVTALEGSVGADRYGLRGVLERARYAGGAVSGKVDYERTPAAGGELPFQTMTVDLDYRGLLLDTLLADQGIPSRGYASRARGEFFYTFPFGQARGGDGRVEIELAADPEQPGLALESGALPLRIEGGVVRADAISVRADRQSVLADGWYDLDRKSGAFDYEIASFDLAELVPLMPALDPSAVWLPAAGRGELAGTLYVDPSDVATEMRLRLEEVATPSGRFESVRGNLFLERAGLDALRLEVGDGEGALLLHGRLPFAPSAGDDTRLVFDAFHWPLETVRPWIDFDLPVDGRISGRLYLHADDRGSDGRLSASVAPAVLTLKPPAGETAAFEPVRQDLDEVSGRLSWNRDELRFHQLDLAGESGMLRGQGTYGWTTGEVDVALASTGLELGAKPLSDYLPRPGIAGEVELAARIQGSVEQPRIEIEASADGIAIGGRRLAARPSHLTLSSAGGRWHADGRLLDMIAVRGGGRLDPGGSDLQLALTGSNLSGLLELLFEEPPEDVDGSFAGTLTIAARDGSVGLVLDELDVDLRGRRLANLEPVSLRASRERVEIDAFILGEEATGSTFSVTGTTGLEVSAPVDLSVRSTMSADWLELADLGLELDGTFDLEARVEGPLDGPAVDGRGELHDGRLVLAGFPYPVENLRGNVRFTPGGVSIDRLEGELAGGRVEITGRADLDETRGEIPSYRLRAKAGGLRLLYPDGWTVEGGTELTLRSTDEGHLVDGRAELTRLEFREDVRFDFAELLRGFLRRQRLEIHPAHSLLSTIQVDLEIEAPGTLRVRNNLADLEGSATLAVRGNLAQPVLYGSVDVAEGGTVVYNSTDYEVDRGRITFTNPYRLDPEIDLVLTTEVRDFDISMTLSGTLERLDTRFSSEPPLPSLEVFRLLATGDIDPQTTALEPTLADTALADRRDDKASSAATFLYGQAAAVIGERFNDLFGFDKFRIDPLTGSGDNLSKTRFTVGKRISKDFFLTYSVDPSSTEEQRLQLEWQVSPGLVLVLTQNGDNSYTADARWESSF